MNRFEARLNPTIKQRMSVHQCASYVDLYDTAVNIERAMKERSHYFNEQLGTKWKGDNRGNFQLQKQYSWPTENKYSNGINWGGQHPNTKPKVTCNTYRKLGHYARECHLVKRCFRCGSPQHQVRDCPLPPPPTGQG